MTIGAGKELNEDSGMETGKEEDLEKEIKGDRIEEYEFEEERYVEDKESDSVPKHPIELARRYVDPEYRCTFILSSLSQKEFEFASPHSPAFHFDAILHTLNRFVNGANFGRFEDPLLLMMLKFINEHLKDKKFGREHLTVMWEVFCKLHLWINKLDAAEQSRIVRLYNSVVGRFDEETRPIFVKRLLFDIANSKASLPYEPQWTAVLIDSYARYLHLPSFQAELGSVWGLLASLKYDNPFTAVAYYSALFLLAKRQALFRINLPMLQTVRRDILDKFQTQIADYVQLKQLEAKAAEIESPKKRSVTLDVDTETEEMAWLKTLLQGTIQDTLKAIEEAK